MNLAGDQVPLTAVSRLQISQTRGGHQDPGRQTTNLAGFATMVEGIPVYRRAAGGPRSMSVMHLPALGRGSMAQDVLELGHLLTHMETQGEYSCLPMACI